jgi:cytosine deaminase
MDPWYSLGCADMLDAAAMGLHVGHLSSLEAMAFCFDAVTVNAAAAMGLEGYGVAVGCKADMVLLDARDRVEAIRTRAARLAVIRGGAVIAESAPREARLALPGRPGTVTPGLR